MGFRPRQLCAAAPLVLDTLRPNLRRSLSIRKGGLLGAWFRRRGEQGGGVAVAAEDVGDVGRPGAGAGEGVHEGASPVHV